MLLAKARVEITTLFRNAPANTRRFTAACVLKEQKTDFLDVQSSVRKPAKQRGHNKLYANADEAIADLQSGSVILSTGFGVCGTAETIITAIRKRKDLNNLTAVSNNAGAKDDGGLAPLVRSGQITRLILSYLGNNKTLEKKYVEGSIQLELCPQGTLAERIRCGGAGIPAFYTPTGAGTGVQSGDIPVQLSPPDDHGKQGVLVHGAPRESRIFNGKLYIMEQAITGDVAIVRAWRVDKAGNCQFRYSTKAFGRIMPRAATISIVEAEEIVEEGEIHPDAVDVPGIFIDRIVPATVPKLIENLKIRTGPVGAEPSADTPAAVRRNRIAKRAAKELKNGFYVNLGVGMPTLAPSFIPEGVKVWIQSENGLLGMGPYPTKEEVDGDLINAGKETVTLLPGASTFDSADSFGMIRGGHVDVSMLGALQVDAFGNLANFMIPGQVVKGMGGAMDLVSNPDATRIVVLTDHVDKHGKSKIVSQCTLPLTGARVVSRIITDLGVFDVDREKGGLTLVEIAPEITVEELKAKTDAPFSVAATLSRLE